MLLTLFFSLGCGDKEVTPEETNIPPEIEITSHSTPVQLISLYPEVFLATVSDQDNAFSDLMVSWYVDGQMICDWQVVNPEGVSLCEIRFNVGDQQLMARVRDLDNTLGETAVTLAIAPNAPPEIQIVSPQNNQDFYLDQLVEFRAWLQDQESDAATIQSVWSSSIDGDLQLNTTPDELGNISDQRYLSEGLHTITLEAEDETGVSSRQEIVITINPANTEPSCTIEHPEDGALSILGEPIALSGTVTDQEWQNDQLSVVWSSSRDGILETQTPDLSGVVLLETDTLTTGLHQIMLEGFDEMGKACLDSRSVLVDNYPTTSIRSPASESVFSIGEEIRFEARTLDGEDLEYILEIEWRSDVEGLLFSGNPDHQGDSVLERDDLSPGIHEITFQSTDSAGLVSSDSITVFINTPPEAPEITLSPNPVFANMDLEAQASNAVDIDEDSISYSYQWWVDGTSHPETSSIIPSTELDQGEVWTVRATPNDGHADGEYAEVSITVSNSLPYFSSEATISPEIAYTNDTVSCSAVAEDIDDGVLDVNYVWTDSEGTVLSETDSYTIKRSDIAVNDTLTCTATSIDAQEETVSSVVSIVLSNTAPIIEEPSISSPTGPFFIDSTLECETSASDPDQGLSISYQWEHNGTVLSSLDTIDLSQEAITAGDRVTCIATTTDDEGISVSSSTTAIICYTTDCDDNLALGSGIGLDMTYIPAGSFTMGSPGTEQGRSTDEASFVAHLSRGYFMSTTEITQEAYEDLRGLIWREEQAPSGVSATHPVYYISWDMAASYANELTKQHNLLHNSSLSLCYTCQNSDESGATCTATSNPYQCSGYRLPTEAEWEYAARSGSITAFWTQDGDQDIPSVHLGDCTAWSFDNGDILENYAWFCGNNTTNEVQPVAEKLPNAFGLYDMHGNIAEWCHDWYQSYYPIGEVDDPVQLIQTAERVIRGGHWSNLPENIRSASRAAEAPVVRFSNVGFRVIRTVE